MCQMPVSSASREPFHKISSSIPLQRRIRDVGEGDAHGCLIPTLLHAAVVDHLAAIAGAQLVEGGVEALVFFGVAYTVMSRLKNTLMNFMPLVSS